MDAKLEAFRLTLLNMDHGELIQTCLGLKSSNIDQELRLEELQSLMTIMTKDYKKQEKLLASEKEENKKLKAMLAHSEDRNALRNRDLFGRSTEKLEDLMASGSAADPISEDASCSNDDEKNVTENPKIKNNKKTIFPFKRQNSGGKKPRRTRSELFADMPSADHYEINLEELDGQYGECGWSILKWERHSTVKCVRTFYYVDNLYSPVITYKEDSGADHSLQRLQLPAGSFLWQKSYASSSLLADSMNHKAVLHVPFNRQAQDMARAGFPVSEQVLCQWAMRAAQEFFVPVYEKICDIVRSDKYQQGDETTLTVIRDGRKAGSVSYIWLHCTGMFSDGPAAAVYEVELTRNADHLRTFYSNVNTAEFFIIPVMPMQAIRPSKKKMKASAGLPDALCTPGAAGQMRLRFFRRKPGILKMRKNFPK